MGHENWVPGRRQRDAGRWWPGSLAVIRWRRLVARRHAQKPLPDAASAEDDASSALRRQEVIWALRSIPVRQREAVVLRYWADLPEASVARLMGISVGTVKGYTSRGLARLGELLGESA